MTNPLLNFDELPKFGDIRAEHVIPALESVLASSRKSIAVLENLDAPSWDNFAVLMEDLQERIDRVWSPVSHLNSVQDSDELREAYQNGIDQLTIYHSEIGQNQNIFRQYQKIKQGELFDSLSDARKKVIENQLIDFVLSGADLDQQGQDRLREINQSLSQLSNQFGRNLLDATQAWSITVTDPEQLYGLPKTAIDAALQAASETNSDDLKSDQKDPSQAWLFSLQIPSYLAVMQHAKDSNLRQSMYQAYAQRASDLSENSDFDNAPIIDQILALRHEKSALLGYPDYAALSLVKKMAASSDAVLEFLGELADHARPMAELELAELRKFAAEHYSIDELQPWDISFYSERLREHQYAFSDEEVRPYFPAPQVFDGLFEIVGRLFNIKLAENNTMRTWHQDVRCFDVFHQGDGRLIGSLYTDLYVRKNKRGGAWMDTCIHRRRSESQLQLPVAYLTCNFSAPIDNQPALLSHQEVETLFHEFGHTLHHLLTEVDEMSVAGISGVAWDAVELPSQFLENWCWQEDSLAIIAKHHLSNEPIPAQLLEKMRAAKNFQSGLQTLRQVEFALFDMRLHNAPFYSAATQLDNGSSAVQLILDQVRNEVALLKPPPYNRFQNSFGHIFAGGYAAGYYSYKWAEVLSADAFGRFQVEGIFNRQTGQDFVQSFLKRGGVDDVNDLFLEFRQRPPKLEPLLRQTGILS